jgi:hypothetical protein
MFGGVSVCDCLDIVEGRFIRERIRMRGSTPEMFFSLTDDERVLPVSRRGGTQVIQWGIRRANDRLPPSPWVRLEDLDAGKLAALDPEEVVIRASRAVDNGVWYEVARGVLAVVVKDELGTPVVYPLVERASQYYAGMTGSEWMPCLLRQCI